MKTHKICQKGLRFGLLLLMLIVNSWSAGLLSAQTEYYADNFDDNVKGDEWYLHEYSPGNATLEERNSRLEFTAEAGELEGVDYVLCGMRLDTSQNFSCKVDWHLSKDSGPGTFAVCLGLDVPSVSEDIVIGAGFRGDLYFCCFSEAADIEYFLSRSETDGVVYISYDAAQDKLYLSINGFWLNENKLAGDWVVEGLLQGAWANKSVFVYLEGDAESAESIEVGDAWFDNFELNFTPFNDSTVNMQLDAGWSMISLPVVPESLVLSDVFPDAAVVYGYKRNAGYVRVQENHALDVGKGYWILLNESRTYTLTGEPIQEYTCPVENGWYMIGGCSSLARASVTNGDIVVIYGYVPGVGYQRFPAPYNLERGGGYWILLSNTSAGAELKVTGR